MDNRARGTGLETRATLFLMYGMLARPLIECGFRWFFVVPLVPHRNCSGAYLLYRRIGLQQVYDQSGKFCSRVVDKSMLGLPPKMDISLKL